jgi:ATP-dependent Clp protease ATP-binding subunit ClpB
MTSNVGSQWIRDLVGDETAMRERVMEALQARFRPEFLNRLDEVILFHSLTQEHLVQIVDIQLERLRGLLSDRKIEVVLTDAAKAALAASGYDPAYGARPLKRAIQRELQDPLALAILQGQFGEGDTVHVDARDGELVLS